MRPWVPNSVLEEKKNPNLNKLSHAADVGLSPVPPKPVLTSDSAQYGGPSHGARLLVPP